MSLPTLVSPILMPSLSSSPWTRGAPHRGFSRHIWRISSRTSWGTGGLPVLPRRIFQVQNSRYPLRCQPITVCGCTMASAHRQLLQTRDRQTHKRRSAGLNLGRFPAERCRTPIWCRRARFSSSSAARVRNVEDRVARSESARKGTRRRRYRHQQRWTDGSFRRKRTATQARP